MAVHLPRLGRSADSAAVRHITGLLVALLLAAFAGCGSESPPTEARTPVPTLEATVTRLTATSQAPTSTPATPTTTPSGRGGGATVASVVDGDTIKVSITGTVQTVRLILIDTPEVFGGEECFGRAASDFTKQLLPAGAPVTLEKDVSETDRFDRLLRYVWLADGRMANEVIVAEGYATLSTFPPDVKYVDRIRAAERQAREAGRGLWAACSASAPVPTVGPTTQPGNCSPSYPDVCIAPPPPDLDCKDVPYRRFRVLPPDPHRFDGSDNDGLGCES